MTSALEPRTVTPDQLDLIRRTIAAGATQDELLLFLNDCQRQRVHPLDKLLHFTKRGGKYTPITSIDFMRTRAAETQEYAGSDDAVFTYVARQGAKPDDIPEAARVTVWRLVQGQRCAFTATARWTEYCPPQGQDHLWRKMPHTMIAKCAEALALRKGFPRQLAGLYAAEELDQADRAPAADAQTHTLGNSDLAIVPDYPTGRPLITDAQRRKLFAAAAAKGWDREQFKAWLVAHRVESTTKIAQADLDAILQMIKDAHAAPQPDESGA